MSKNWLCMLGVVLLVGTTVVMADKAEKRAEIDAMADEALAAVMEKADGAKGLFEKAYGYAAFDNIKVTFIVSGGGGSGVAVTKSGDRTYMKMGTGGVGLGVGGQQYQVVFLFETEAAFTSFIEKGWQADAAATASAGDAGANVAATFKNGVALWQMTDKGLMAAADITGTKYWANDKLNKDD